MPDIYELMNKLLSDLQDRFMNDKIKFDTQSNKVYFKNIPGEFLPWSKRSNKFNDIEKALINKLVVSSIAYFDSDDMRWYLLAPTYRETEKIIRNIMEKL
ncbi:MAG: hypothetical protein KDH96_00895 [Candidatus Riesia sp.]|nr:hypothetical protein [Candidatus Riesia sp.]